ncbi:MAG: ABC transporter permease [Gemmataceae bacterium]
MAQSRWSPLWQLTQARLKEFFRIPEAVFWVYGFPLLMTVALGIAFRTKPVEKFTIDVIEGSAPDLVSVLGADKRFDVEEKPEAEARQRLKRARTELLIEMSRDKDGPRLLYWYDPNRTESVAARNLVDDVLVRSKTPGDVLPTSDRAFEQPGSRYIDFLVPGLLGMNLMGGGLWGVGFVVVDLRVRKLLKRFLATPMRRSDFLLALMLSRLLFMIPEVLTLLLFAWFAFAVGVQGSVFTLLVVIFLGAASFAGLGLLVASRARTNEAVSGLMNLVMLPMWILSGVFFSSERFPAEIQPLIQALPLTALNDSLRAVMLDGAGFADIAGKLAILAAWGGISFAIALRFFRWR